MGPLHAAATAAADGRRKLLLSASADGILRLCRRRRIPPSTSITRGSPPWPTATANADHHSGGAASVPVTALHYLAAALAASAGPRASPALLRQAGNAVGTAAQSPRQKTS